MECNHRETLKWKDDQPSRESVPCRINIQDNMCKLFTNVPMRSEKKYPQLEIKVFTNIVRSIEE